MGLPAIESAIGAAGVSGTIDQLKGEPCGEWPEREAIAEGSREAVADSEREAVTDGEREAVAEGSREAVASDGERRRPDREADAGEGPRGTVPSAGASASSSSGGGDGSLDSLRVDTSLDSAGGDSGLSGEPPVGLRARSKNRALVATPLAPPARAARDGDDGESGRDSSSCRWTSAWRAAWRAASATSWLLEGDLTISFK